MLACNLYQKISFRAKGEIWDLGAADAETGIAFPVEYLQIYLYLKGKKQASCLSEQVRGQYEETPFDLSSPPIFSVRYVCCVLLFSLFLRESVSIVYVKKLCSEDTASSAKS